MLVKMTIPFLTCLVCLGVSLFAFSQTNEAFRQMGEPKEKFQSTVERLRETEEMFSGDRVATTLEGLSRLDAEERRVTLRMVNLFFLVLAGGFGLVALQTLAIAYHLKDKSAGPP